MNIDKISELFEEGEKETAIELLENYVSFKTKLTEKIINAYATLLEFKFKMGLDCSKEIEILESIDEEDLWSFTFFMLGLYFEKAENKEKAQRYFDLFHERVNDPQQFAEILGYPDEWKRIEKEYIIVKNITGEDIFVKCNFGENIETLSEKEQIYVLCEGFVEEVNSGGFEAYFSTGYSKHCVKTVEYLEKYKSKIYAKMLKKAIALFPEDFDFSDPLATEDYLDAHEKILDKLEKLEEKIYESTEDIEHIKEQI